MVGLVRVERMEAESFPPGPSGRVQGGDDDGAACRLLVELDGCREHVAGERGPDPETRVWRSTASRPRSSAGTGSGAPLASVSGAAERSMPVIATLAYATTTSWASAMTQVAAVSRRRFCPA